MAADAGARRRPDPGRWSSPPPPGRRTRSRWPRPSWRASPATSRWSARWRSTRTTTRWSGRWWPGASRGWRPGSGDQVRRGQILAEIESAEVGQARADLVARQGALVAAAEANLHARDRAGGQADLLGARARAGPSAVGDGAGRRAGGDHAAAGHRPVRRRHRQPRARRLAGRVPIRAPIGGDHHRAQGDAGAGGGAGHRRLQDRRHLARLGRRSISTRRISSAFTSGRRWRSATESRPG